MGDEGSEPDDELSTTLVSENEGKQKVERSQNHHTQSGRNRDPFNTIKQLRASHDTCNLCDLIYRAITRYGNDVNDDTPCSLYWEVHGREPRDGGDGVVKKTRWMRLTWIEISGNRNRHEIYLILVAPHDPLQLNSDVTARHYKNNHFLGRASGDQKEKQALIKSWINLCTQGQKLCRDNHDTDEAFRDLMEEFYFGVIDVADMQLKSLPRQPNGMPDPYVALSYVWGRPARHEPPYVTTRRSIMTHICHGGLETPWEKLPQNIQDAILIKSRLGYRYLWIDALCIVQDSKSSWQLNASAMHLMGMLNSRSVPPMALDSVSSLKNFDGVDLQPLNAECAPGVCLMVSRPLEAVIDNSVWSKLAWTLQERILSRRCLIFAEGRVYWQCRSIGISEDIHTDGSSQGLSLDPITSPLRTLQELQGRPLRSYMSYVRIPHLFSLKHQVRKKTIYGEGIPEYPLLYQHLDEHCDIPHHRPFSIPMRIGNIPRNQTSKVKLHQCEKVEMKVPREEKNEIVGPRKKKTDP
ncbi:hypothetical protein N7488_006893 [Penicillium malachiteum]|nr:hypothetical protein N7488_006893 [Penicillium malachiteum]